MNYEHCPNCGGFLYREAAPNRYHCKNGCGNYDIKKYEPPMTKLHLHQQYCQKCKKAIKGGKVEAHFQKHAKEVNL